MNLQVLILFALIQLINSLNESILLNSNEVFIIPIKRTDFDKQISKDEQLSITATINSMPDLPENVYFKQKDSTKDALLFGMMDSDENVEIELIAKQLTTYETYRNVIKLSFTPKDREPKNQVELKINNLNVEDMQSEKNKMVDIFRKILWTNTSDLFMTMIASPLDVGGRAPLNPKQKEGVVFRVSSKSPFSPDLLWLDRETDPVKNRVPCPSKLNTFSMEYVFKKRNFQVDWCRFKLIKKETNSVEYKI